MDIQIPLRFLQFVFNARTKYQVHSPFVFEFVNEVLEDERQYYAFQDLEVLRKKIKSSTQSITLEDYGAGSKKGKVQTRSIRDIANNALANPQKCRLLFRIVRWHHPQNILELGSSLGISTLYQHFGQLNARIITLEGDSTIANLAKSHFEMMNSASIELRKGRFEDQLPGALNALGRLDYCLIDGNHRKEPTLAYFYAMLPFTHNDSLLVFDDIHWSAEMESAWETIRQHPAVTLSIDLFHYGLVFFRKEQINKEHFCLLPSSWKPWQKYI